MRLTPLLYPGAAAVVLMTTACAQESRPADTNTAAQPAPSIASDYSAWWKDEGKVAATDTSVAGAPLPGWQKMPPVQGSLAKHGSEVFTAKCASCHSIGRGQVVGPDLAGVTHRVEPDWAKNFMANPAPMLESDAHAKELLAKYLVKMPDLKLTPDQLDALVEYFRESDQVAASQRSKEPHS